MSLIWEGIKEAVKLLLSGDQEVLQIALLSIKVSACAVFISMLLGVPLGIFLALTDFFGKRVFIALVNTGMGLPPVVAGLFISLLLWRNAPLGFLNLLYTPSAMVIAQVLIATPIVAGLTLAAIQQLNPKLRLQALSLGASRWQTILALLKEAQLPTLAAAMAGFGGVISEVGAVMMVGGNIRGETRVLTTAIVTETRMGHFNMAIALSVILLALTFGINLVLTHIQQKGVNPWARTWR